MSTPIPQKIFQAPPTQREIDRAKRAESLPLPSFLQQRGNVLLAETVDMRSARLALRGRPVPDDFGVPSGTPIANKDTILPDLWRSLGSNKPPAAVFILVKGQTSWGHAAVAYRRPDGELTCMNIVGRRGQSLANFMPLEEYLFGVKELDHHDASGKLVARPKELGGPWGNPEGGAYHRDFDMVVVWDWPQNKLDDMHKFFLEVNHNQDDHAARFRLAPGFWRDTFDSIVKGDSRESGNCALWTSRGMEIAGLVDMTSTFPKRIAVNMLHGIGKRDTNNLDLVCVPGIPHARRTHKSGGSAAPLAQPLGLPVKPKLFSPNSLIISGPLPILDTRYWNLGHRAAATLHYEGEIAHIIRSPRELSRL